jgi:hypothetical protein
MRTGLQGALGLLLLSLAIVGTGTGQTPVVPADSASTVSPTEVVILGALHDFHHKNPHFSLEVLTRLIVSSRPQAILVELPETSGGNPTIRAGCLVEEFACLNEFRSIQQAADELKVAIHPFDMDRLDDIRRETRFWERQREAAQQYAAFLKAHGDDEALAELRSLESFEESLKRCVVTFAEKGTPEIINSEAFDSVLRARKRLKPVGAAVLDRAIQAHPQHEPLLRGRSFVGEEWQRRNECMAEKIASFAKQYQSQRIVVVVGAEHRHMLRDLLESQSGLICREYWELE